MAEKKKDPVPTKTEQKPRIKEKSTTTEIREGTKKDAPRVADTHKKTDR